MYGAAGSGQTPGAGVKISRREEEGTCASIVSEADDRGKTGAAWNQIQLATRNKWSNLSVLQKRIFPPELHFFKKRQPRKQQGNKMGPKIKKNMLIFIVLKVYTVIYCRSENDCRLFCITSVTFSQIINKKRTTILCLVQKYENVVFL